MLGEDPDREGLQDTPRRVAAMYTEMFRGLLSDPPRATVFENEDGYNQMIVCSNVPVYSVCEHHLVPFFGTAHVAYIPKEKIVGLSKIPRVVQHFAARPQVQERLTHQISHHFYDILRPIGIITVLECRHLCMEMRGVRTPGVTTTTSAILGELDVAEFFSIIRRSQ